MLWAEGSDDVFAEFEFVFYVRARDVVALSGKSAIDVLRLDEFDFTARQQEELTEYLSDNSDKVLVLLDGADEGGEMWKESKGLEKILQRKGGLHNCSFVITSRPCEAAYQLVPTCEQHFNITGLNDQHLEELLRRRLGQVEGEKLSETLKQTRWCPLRSLMAETPLVANIVTALADNGLSLPKSATELYTLVVVNMARRAVGKTQAGHFSGGTLEELPCSVKAGLLKIGKLALAGLKIGRYVFILEKDVQPTCGSLAKTFGLLVEFHTTSIRGDQHYVQFCHLTYQEFLAAYHVAQSDELVSELESCRREIGFGEEAWSFWRFLGGLLGPAKVKTLTWFLQKCDEGQQMPGAERWLILKMSLFAEAMLQPCSEGEDEEKVASCGREAAIPLLPRRLSLCSHVMSMWEVHAVSVSLAYAEQTTELNLSYCDLDREQVGVLSTSGGFRHIIRLTANGNRQLHGNGLGILAAAIGQSGKLSGLSLLESQLDDADSPSLCTILTGNPCLRQLVLGYDTLSPAVLKQLQPRLIGSKLRWLSFVHARLDAEGAKVVGEVLAHNDCLQKVDLSGNELGNDGAAAV